MMDAMKSFGINPLPEDIYWETPYSNYGSQGYNYEAALKASDFNQRQYEICTKEQAVNITRGIWALF
ncbi:hypothetical protein J4731_09145 [Providencia rettgeri]|nr:hypothetical protein [Providencia rettgeri]